MRFRVAFSSRRRQVTHYFSRRVNCSSLLLRRVVQDAVDDLREDMENSIKAMHIDMIRSFQRQSDEMRDVFAQQNQTISILEAVNMDLRRQLGEQRRFFSSEEY